MGIKDVVFKDGNPLSKSQIQSYLAWPTKGVAFLNFADKSYGGLNAPSGMLSATSGDGRSAVFVGNLEGKDVSPSTLVFRTSEVADHELGHRMGFYSRGETMSFIMFWNHDPDQRGWYVYGKGTVTEDAKQVAPDPGIAIYEFTGAMVGSTSYPTSFCPVPCDRTTADPIDPSSGLFIYSKTDLVVADVIPLVVTRSYRQSDGTSRAFGIGTTGWVHICSPKSAQS